MGHPRGIDARTGRDWKGPAGAGNVETRGPLAVSRGTSGLVRRLHSPADRGPLGELRVSRRRRNATGKLPGIRVTQPVELCPAGVCALGVSAQNTGEMRAAWDATTIVVVGNGGGGAPRGRALLAPLFTAGVRACVRACVATKAGLSELVGREEGGEPIPFPVARQLEPNARTINSTID